MLQEKEVRDKKLYLLTRDNPVNVPSERLYQMAKEKGWKEYSVLYKTADHIHNYQQKYISIVPDEYADRLMLEQLKTWCEKYKKNNNKWHQDLVLEMLKKLRS
jgi:hypothetical protein